MNQKQETALQRNDFLRCIITRTLEVEDAVVEGDLVLADQHLGHLVHYVDGACAGARCFGEDLPTTYPVYCTAWESVYERLHLLWRQSGPAGAKKDAKLILTLMAELRAATLQEGVLCSDCGALLVQCQNC